MSRKTRVTPGSGNVFADLGMETPEELLAKAELVRQISGILADLEVTQTAAAKLLGTTQPKVSDLLRGRMDGFSLERLIRYLNALDRYVEIFVRKSPRSRKRGNVSVSAA